MTAVTEIISRALRETNLIALGTAPTAPQQQEAFALLSTIVSSVLGNEMGENLSPLALGGDHINAPSGYPWWQNNLPDHLYIRPNTRLMLNLTGPGYAYFSPQPHDGARMGVVDCSGNLDTHPLTIHGNGRKIDGSTEVILDTPGITKEWAYREDLGEWVTSTPLELLGEMPWPSEFDDMFIIMLALRLNPRYGQVIHPASAQTLQDIRKKFTSRYSQTTTFMPSEDGLLYLTNPASQYQLDRYNNTTQQFYSGYPF